MQRSSYVVLVFALASAACSDSGAGTEFGCSDPTDESFCTQFVVLDEDDLDDVKESCALGGIRDVIDTCPSEGVAGCCVLETAFYTANQCYYAPNTAEQVQDQCTSLGQGFVTAP